MFDDLLDESRRIWELATEDSHNYTIAMISGGDDSLTAYHVAKTIGVKFDAIMHGVTGTGIPQTTDFVRQLAVDEGLPYVEANAGDAFEKYVLRKGFFGRGQRAHTYAYHILKLTPFRKAISANFRKRRRNIRVLLINGARYNESDNRKQSKPNVLNSDPAQEKDVWVNIIHHWTKPQCLAFLKHVEAKRNPVTLLCHRSGECLCGTMQSQEAREEIATFYPDWGAWLDDLEARVFAKHGWRWGESVPKWKIKSKKGQEFLPGFAPMCVSCKALDGLAANDDPDGATT